MVLKAQLFRMHGSSCMLSLLLVLGAGPTMAVDKSGASVEAGSCDRNICIYDRWFVGGASSTSPLSSRPKISVEHCRRSARLVGLRCKTVAVGHVLK